MKYKLPYIIAFIILLATEIYIGVFVRDKFIRSYFGDILITILLCVFVRCVTNKWRTIKGSALLCGGVFLFSICAEIGQYFRLDKLLGVNGTVIGVILGSNFSYIDIACYAVGCVMFFAAESVTFKILNKHL